MMLPFMQNQLTNQEDNLADMRRFFLEADVDGSGFLTADEIYNAINKMGADVTRHDVVELMMELDSNGDGQLDIDEFTSLISLGD